MSFRPIVVLCLSALVFAQQAIPPGELELTSTEYVPPSLFSLRTETRLAEVGVVVRDSSGHTVGGLSRNDFEVDDGGHKREITAFSVETNTPRAPRPPGATAVPAPSPTAAPAASKPPVRYLAMVFDDLNMSAGDLIPARKAAKKFLTDGFSPGDLVGIFFLTRGQILPFTADVDKLNAALDKLNFAQRSAHLPTCPDLTAYEAYLIANRQDPTLLPAKVAEAIQCGFCQPRDRNCPMSVESLAGNSWREISFLSTNTLAALRGIVDFMAKQPGKRVMLLTSAGFITSTLEYEREDIVNRALRGEVVINSLDAKGLFTLDMGVSRPGTGNIRALIARQSMGTRPQQESNDAMAILAAGTGGLFFQNNNDLDRGYRELGLAPEFSYSLAFTPPNAPDGRYHNLKVRLKDGRHYNVQARPGYFAAAAQSAPPPSERRIDKELMATDSVSDVPVTLSAAGAKMPDGAPALRVILRVDVPHLPFISNFGVHSQLLTVIAALFDDSGTFITGKECELNFHLKDDTFQKINGPLNAGLTLTAAPGKYRLRVVVLDGNSGKMTASSAPVDIS